MGKLDNLDGAIELFRQIGGEENEHCIFFAEKDTSKMTVVGGVSGTVAGGVLGDIAEAVVDAATSTIEFSRELNLDELNRYNRFLIDETTNSLIIVPVDTKALLSYKFDEMEAIIEAGRVIPKNQIESIEVKKFSLFTPNFKSVKIKLSAGYKLEFMVSTNLKKLPYHVENFTKFCEKHKN